MDKRIFITGYGGDIGNCILTKLNAEILEKNINGNIILINGREKINKIKNDFKKSVCPNSNNILINCIGYGTFGMFLELNHKQIKDSFNGNFLVPLKIFKLFIENIKKNSIIKRTKVCSFIVNINSKASQTPFYQGVAYNSMKAAISMGLKIIEKEYAKYGLIVKELYPGLINTKMVKNIPYIPNSGIQGLDEFGQEVIGLVKNL